MDFRRLTREFIMTEGKKPVMETYLQSIEEAMGNLRASSLKDERRIAMAKENLKQVKRYMRGLQKEVETLKEQVKVLEENKG